MPLIRTLSFVNDIFQTQMSGSTQLVARGYMKREIGMTGGGLKVLGALLSLGYLLQE